MAETKQATAGPTERVRVLVIFPDRAQQQAALAVCKGCGEYVDVDVVCDGIDAIELFKTRVGYAPDIVLVWDILPRMNALLTVKQLRHVLSAARIVVASDVRQYEKKFRSAGADQVISPARLSTLVPGWIAGEVRRRELAPDLLPSTAIWARGDGDKGSNYDVESISMDDWLERSAEHSAEHSAENPTEEGQGTYSEMFGARIMITEFPAHEDGGSRTRPREIARPAMLHRDAAGTPVGRASGAGHMGIEHIEQAVSAYLHSWEKQGKARVERMVTEAVAQELPHLQRHINSVMLATGFLGLSVIAIAGYMVLGK